MGARLIPFQNDPIRPSEPTPVTITFDGQSLSGVAGQSIAGVIMANERLGFRRTSTHDAPRGVFCGIGVCFDCLVTVDGVEDVRACQRRARDGDAVTTQHHALPQSHQHQPHQSELHQPEPHLPGPHQSEPHQTEAGQS